MNRLFRVIFAALGILFVAGVIGRVVAESDTDKILWNRAILEVVTFAIFIAFFWGVGKNTDVVRPKPGWGKAVMVVGMAAFWLSAIAFIASIRYPALPQISVNTHLWIQGGCAMPIAVGVIIGEFAKQPWDRLRIVKR